MGYNWLKSNEDAAQDIAKKLDVIKKNLEKDFINLLLLVIQWGLSY